MTRTYVIVPKVTNGIYLSYPFPGGKAAGAWSWPLTSI